MRSLRLLIALVLLATGVGCAPRDVQVGSNRGPDGGIPGLRATAVCTQAAPANSVSTPLPGLPELTSVTGCVTHDSAQIRFDPVEGAKDYRVYVLPSPADVSASSDGSLSVRNAIYRCAGDRMAPAPTVDAITSASSGTRTLVADQTVGGYRRPLAEATLGYVYATAGIGRQPVYALGAPGPHADNGCNFGRFAESRVKKYTTSAVERAALIAQRWRDDGVTFYVPSDGATPVLTSTSGGTRYYFSAPAEAAMRTGAEPAFKVFPDRQPGTLPLMRVFYENLCGDSHDELTAGPERFARAWRQGNQPAWELRWSGISGPTTLVVEALDEKCPWPGMLAPASKPSYRDYPAWITLDEARAASSTGEVFINGQGEGTRPRPIARSFVTVSPTPAPPLDWFESFDRPLAPLAAIPCGAPPGANCWQQFRRASKDLDTFFYSAETERNALAQVLGELWVGLADVGAGTNAKFRLTPSTRARLSPDSFLYVTLETDTLTTGRRYPQLAIADVEPPLDWTLKNGRALLVRSAPVMTASWPNQLRIEVCDHQAFDEGLPCPAFHDLHENLDPSDPKVVTNLAPSAEVAEHSGLGRATQWEVYASTARIYLFLDGAPYGCADLPPNAPSGKVSVTFGYVLAHSSIDDMTGLSRFLGQRSLIESHRHFDNLGFSSGVAAPSWDESLLPCARASQMK